MAQGVNNNSAVVVVGRTAPVPPGQQTAANSVPVVVASDQSPIPVEEQNKQQSEVALSLLGIPRSEVALGIFADVNTYDVNPTEWSIFPEQFGSADITNDVGEVVERYSNIGGQLDWGLTHIAEEAGAMIEAPADKYTILTSKRFFRYQPGRVSAATFGVKLSRAPYTIEENSTSGFAIRNPSVKKYGIFDKYDGYYFESRNDGYGDNFTCVRRTQSIIRDNPKYFGDASQVEDYAWVGVPQIESNAATYIKAYNIIKANKRYLQEVAQTGTLAEERDECRRDAGLVLESIMHDLRYGGNASTVYTTLRFFNKANDYSLYIDNQATEIARYAEVLSRINTILSGNNPGTVTVNADNRLPATLSAVLPSSLNITLSGSEVTASQNAVSNLIGILRKALGSDTANVPNYSSIPSSPTGSAAGEMCILRDGLVMTHAAAFDPSLLRPTVDYSITELFTDASGSATSKWLKIVVPADEKVLEIGQGVMFNKNEGSGYLEDSSNANQTLDGSIWYIREVLNSVVQSGVLYQYVKICKNPSNEESYKGYNSGTNPTNPWGTLDTDLAYSDLEPLNVTGAFDGVGAAINDNSVGTLGFSLQTPIPFILPNDQRAYQGQQYTDESRPGQEGFPSGSVDGAFPYLYPPASGSVAQGTQGYIDTVWDQSDQLKRQMNYVNKRLFKNWVWFNVDPKFYKVYEYRVPRSRFSGEKLNGKVTPIVYSDNVLDKQAGASVLETTTSEQLEFQSVWDLDPTKVTMYKIEFSWYGAVGATFLAYVPIDNNEARWVRVHHLRASNQLKVASLGNATLPITYLAYGGGGENSYGYLNADRNLKTESGYGSYSEQLTKYGASYYIDGGDRGTVRLFSYARDELKEIGGSRYVFDEADHANLFDNTGDYYETTADETYVNAPYLTFNTSSVAAAGYPAISDYYMNAKIVTDNAADQDVRIVWTDNSTRLYLSRPLQATAGVIRVIVDRPQPLVGIKCRTEINGVRNRVQIYPTRLATGVTSQSESMVVQLRKTPVFPTLTTPVGSLRVDDNTTNSLPINIGKRGKRTVLPTTGTDGVIQVSNDYIPIGESVWGYFRYTIENDTSGLAFTTLGLLDRGENGRYYFSAYEVSLDNHLIRGTFLPAKSYTGAGPVSPVVSPSAPYPTSTLARLSAVETDTEIRSPIPGTGTVVTTLFSPNSGEEYELSPYFDYNKDYLSFPLTDIQETLYVCAESKSDHLDSGSSGSYAKRGEILASITWEEQ